MRKFFLFFLIANTSIASDFNWQYRAFLIEPGKQTKHLVTENAKDSIDYHALDDNEKKISAGGWDCILTSYKDSYNAKINTQTSEQRNLICTNKNSTQVILKATCVSDPSTKYFNSSAINSELKANRERLLIDVRCVN